MTEEVKFIRGNDRINQLAQRPDIADGVTRVRAEMAEADRTYAMGLAALRQAAELTQAELARRLGVTQAAGDWCGAARRPRAGAPAAPRP